MAFSSLRIDETVPPSKVVHFRNLPEQCSHEDLTELCNPFGKVVNLLCNVGPNKNQGFAEFEDLNDAISMVSNYASSPDPVEIHGRNIYVQYSDRPEIVISRFGKGNILLVTMEEVKAGDVSIDAMSLVFSEYGLVQKISTFEKNSGFQEALDGKNIPRQEMLLYFIFNLSLLPEHISDCKFRIAYSGHRELNIKFQSNRSRDYTNATLPVNEATIARALQPIPRTADNHVLLASFENMLQDVTLDVLHGVDVATAKAAKNTLEGRCIYAGGYSKIHLTYSRHDDVNVKDYGDKSRDYSKPEHSVPQAPATAWQNPYAASMNPSSGVHAYPYCYISAPATFPDQVYAYPLEQSNPMVPTAGYIGVPPFSPQMQGFLGFFPIQPYYYGY
ncbi:hypothetical protein ACSQ67_008324 [Phaseolus vulgaris]